MAKHPQNLPPAEQLLTIPEVAKLDGCSQKTVRRAIDLGQLQSLCIGPKGWAIRIPVSAHRAYRARLFSWPPVQ